MRFLELLEIVNQRIDTKGEKKLQKVNLVKHFRYVTYRKKYRSRRYLSDNNSYENLGIKLSPHTIGKRLTCLTFLKKNLYFLVKNEICQGIFETIFNFDSFCSNRGRKNEFDKRRMMKNG